MSMTGLGSPPATLTDLQFSRVDAIHFAIAQCNALTRVTQRPPSRCVPIINWPEAVFGQMKNNMHYKRFRHFGKDKVTMDSAFFAIAFNIKKMAAIMAKSA